MISYYLADSFSSRIHIHIVRQLAGKCLGAYIVPISGPFGIISDVYKYRFRSNANLLSSNIGQKIAQV